MKGLLIGTSTKLCSVALSEGNKILNEVNLDEENFSHAEKLGKIVHDLVEPIGKPDFIAVDLGPGSFTGLRIGASLVKGLSFGWNIPVVGIISLDILRAQVETKQVVAMLDARRDEVYAKQYTEAGESDVEAIAFKSNPNYLNDFIGQELTLVGEGSTKVQEFIEMDPLWMVSDSIKPIASAMLELALLKIAENDYLNLVDFEPYYLKEFLLGKKKGG